MRTIRFLTFLGLSTLFPCLARADSIRLIDPTGATFNEVFAYESGLMFSGDEVTLVFGSSTVPSGSVIGISGGFFVQTGPLVQHDDTSWIFDGGRVDTNARVTYFPLPDGYASCEAAGFTTGPQGCMIAGPKITASLTDDVSFRVGGAVSVSDSLIVRKFDLTGDVAFEIDPALASVMRINTGVYRGSFDVSGLFFHSPAGDPGLLDEPRNDQWHSIESDSVEMSGNNDADAVPEPTCLAVIPPLLATGALILRKRLRS